MEPKGVHIGWHFWLLWVLASAAGLATFGIVYGLSESITLGFIVMGAAAGLGQWLILRQRLSQASWWVLASTMGFAAFGAVPAVFESVNGTMGFALGVAVVLSMVSTYGAITGTVLVWLLRQ